MHGHDRLARDSSRALDAHRHEPAHVGQVVGTFRLARVPWVNPSWHTTLYMNARGLTRGPARLDSDTGRPWTAVEGNSTANRGNTKCEDP